MMYVVLTVGDPAYEAKQIWSGGVGVHHSETEAAEHARFFAAQGVPHRVYKLVETHYFKGRPDAPTGHDG